MIWLIGCRSVLGKAVEKELKANKLYMAGTDAEVDINDAQALERFEKSMETAAYMPSRLSHTEREIKWVINANFLPDNDTTADSSNGELNIARLTRKIGAKLISTSSAEVFDGASSSPYPETAKKNPCTTLGKAKARGEEAIAKEMNQYYILRTSFLYGSESRQDFEELLTAMENSSANQDIRINPVCVTDLAEIIVKLIKKSESSPELFGPKSAPSYGIYNFAQEGETTLSAFTRTARSLLAKKKELPPEAGSGPAQINQTLSTEKLVKAMKLKQRSWLISLEKFIKTL